LITRALGVFISPPALLELHPMKRYSLLVYSFCLSVFLVAVSGLNALTIPASEDSYTASGNKLNNLTNDANGLIVDATRKSYLYFDLSEIPSDAVVRWAKLRLFLPTVRTAGAGLSVHLVTGTWNESTRLADVPAISAGTIGVIPPSKMASRRFVTVDVTNTVQQWINGGALNEGFAVQSIVAPGSLRASVMLTSKEGPVFGLPAELDIEFQPEGGVDKPVTLGQLPANVQALLNPQPVKLEGINQLPSSLVNLLTPAITQQSQLTSWEAGLSVGARGVGLLRYQWLRDGVAVGTQSANASLPISLSGTYSVVVSNEVASITSTPIVIEGPRIVQPPADLKVIAGSLATFKVVPGGTPPFTYQWRADGGWLHVNTAKSQSMSLPLIYGAAMADIDVIVRNGVGSITSGTAKLKVVCGTLLVDGGTLPASSALGPLQVQPFYIGNTEVTYQRWEAVRLWALANGYNMNVGRADGFDDYPRVGSLGLYAVSYVTWYDVIKWCNARSQMEGRIPVYYVNGEIYKSGEAIPDRNPFADGYRLPSEAEWEFAARGGALSNNYAYSGSSSIDAVAWHAGNSNSQAGEVASKLPNELGLFDMSGNALEWCFDLDEYGSRRAVRGGKWAYGNLLEHSVGFRGYELPYLDHYYGLGFRVAVTPIPRGGVFALVAGGTLPASSPLGAVPVQAFYIGTTEVTWGEWQTVRTWAVANGYTDLDGVGEGVDDNYPVTHVNWFDVVKWCNARSEKEGKTPVYKNGSVVYRTGNVSEPAIVASANGYRLPSEKEWEFAARGGTQTHGYTYSGSNDLNAVGWYTANSGGALKEVGKKQASELGIYDMSGNLWEWSGSWYPGSEGSVRVIRGGHWGDNAGNCSVANRDGNNPESRTYYNGFRVGLSSVP
jgi:sulfatase modifying factor 1